MFWFGPAPVERERSVNSLILLDSGGRTYRSPRFVIDDAFELPNGATARPGWEDGEYPSQNICRG